MIRVALLTSALLACAGAHVYERCELARELTSLGVQRDHLATWVCIAYHESRFDTAARNHGSGDHGLFQISELYWCGPGKACGAPCTAFRDEDISNDLQCALKIHKEHTRLQGDGFLAWVVYPQHCKHINAKKYLVDCEASLKNVPVNLDARSRSIKNHEPYTTPKPFDADYYAKNLPTFLAINSIFEGNQAKQIEVNDQKIDWLNFKIDNIDNIKLPMLDKDALIKFVTPPPTTTTTVNSIEDESIRNLKNDWINYKFDNIDSIRLPSFNRNSDNLPNWLNIKIDSSIDDRTLPVISSNAVNRPVTPPSTPTTLVNYENIDQNYKNDWINFKIDNIDDIQLPPLGRNVASQRNNGQPNWLNIKINSKIDDLDLPTFLKIANVEPPTRAIPTTTTTIRTTTIDPELIGIKPPMPRRIETNQFRRKMMEVILAIQEVTDIKNVVQNAVSLSDFNKNRIIETTTTARTTTTAIPSQPSTTIKTVTNNNSWLTTRPTPTTENVFNFQWKSTARPNFFTKEVATQKSVDFRERVTSTTVTSKHLNTKSVTETKQAIDELQVVTKVNSLVSTQSPYNKDNNKINSIDTVTTTKPPTTNKYVQGRSSTTTSQPATTSRFKYSYSFPILTTTVKPLFTSRNFSFDWNKHVQDRFTLKPFSISTQKSTTSKPYIVNSATLKPFMTNASKVGSYQDGLNISKSASPQAISSTAKPFWGWTSSRSSDVFNFKTAQTSSLNKNNTTASSLYKPLFSTISSSNKSVSIEEISTVQSASTTTTVAPIRQRFSFSFGTNTAKSKPLEPQLNTSQSVIVQTVTLPNRPFWTYKNDVFKTSNTLSTKSAQLSTVRPISDSGKSLEYNSSSTVRPQTITEKSPENPPDQLATKSPPSIFDLYLRPKAFQSAPRLELSERKFGANKLTIFSGGTTPPAANFTPVKP